jgi:tetratricopeptide (TPR) repeat protein
VVEGNQGTRLALEIGPELAEAQVNLGTLYGRQRRSETAEKWFRRALEIPQTHFRARLNLGLTHLTQVFQACGKCTSAGVMHKSLGLIYLSSGDVYNREAQLQLALRKAPGDPEVLSILQKVGTFSRAEVSNRE